MHTLYKFQICKFISKSQEHSCTLIYSIEYIIISYISFTSSVERQIVHIMVSKSIWIVPL